MSTTDTMTVEERLDRVNAVMVAIETIAVACDDYPGPRQPMRDARNHGRGTDGQGPGDAGHGGAQPRLLTAHSPDLPTAARHVGGSPLRPRSSGPFLCPAVGSRRLRPAFGREPLWLQELIFYLLPRRVTGRAKTTAQTTMIRMNADQIG